MEQVRAGALTLISSPALLAELAGVMNRPKFQVILARSKTDPERTLGDRLAEEAYARCAEIKVLYTTGYARNAIVHHGLVDPGVNSLPKPYTIQALGRKVRQVLES